MKIFLFFVFIATSSVCYSQEIGLTFAKEFTSLNQSNNVTGFGISVAKSKKKITLQINGEYFLKNTYHKDNCLGCLEDTVIDYLKLSFGVAAFYSIISSNFFEFQSGPRLSYFSVDSKFTGVTANWFGEIKTKNLGIGLTFILKCKNAGIKNLNLNLFAIPAYSMKIKQHQEDYFKSELSNNQTFIDLGAGLSYIFK